MDEKRLNEMGSYAMISERNYERLVSSLRKHRKLNIILILGGAALIIYKLTKKNDNLIELNKLLKDENDALKISKGK